MPEADKNLIVILDKTVSLWRITYGHLHLKIVFF